MEEERGGMTPMVRQYMEIKKEHQDKVLFFRLGDFYEMFNDDAVKVSRILNLTLTHRGDMPMCGIPYHAARNYLRRLLDYGIKVALCEQFVAEGDKGLARREVTQVYTPATVVDDEYLDSLTPSFVLAIHMDRKGLHGAWTDITTGDFRVRTLPLSKDCGELESVLYEISPKEIIVSDDLYFSDRGLRDVLDRQNAILSKVPSYYFSLKEGRKQAEKQFSPSALRVLEMGEKDPLLCVIGALLLYLSQTARQELPQLRVIEKVSGESYMGLSAATMRNLELVSPLSSEGGSTLCSVMKRTLTPGGGRFLRYAIVHPLSSLEKIQERQKWVTSLIGDRDERERVRSYLSSSSDLERLASKIGMRRSVPRDLIAVADSASAFLSLLEGRDEYLSLLPPSSYDWDGIMDLALLITAAIDRECTNVNDEGTVIRSGFDSELDRLRRIAGGGSDELESYLAKIREETGIVSLKCGENRIIGNYLEVPKGQLSLVPSYFIRRQTLVGGERFTTEELNAIRDRIFTSRDEAAKRERTVYNSVLEKAFSLKREIEAMGKVLSVLDFYQSLATIAHEKNWTMPTVTPDGEFNIVDGRHPVVEEHTDFFTPNSFSTEVSRFALITGPNMAGKSTYLRQVALITLLAHMGSSVPAVSASIPMTDRIFCRVGAQDNLSRGESTFLVEMAETAQILRSATPRSLVIMDEIGRGTSTQDGMSIAYAVMEYLKKCGSVTLFATHYHELTMLDTDGMMLLHMAVKEEKGSVTFLRKATPGAAASSYGIHVARIAGVPRPVVQDALNFQRRHFADYSTFSGEGNLFTSEPVEIGASDEILGMLDAFDPDSTTPLEALLLLSEMKKRRNE